MYHQHKQLNQQTRTCADVSEGSFNTPIATIDEFDFLSLLRRRWIK
jgi:hypothetical protein